MVFTEPDGCPRIPELNRYGQTVTPTFTPLPSLTATPSATRNPSTSPSATPLVPTQAAKFNNQGHVFGLPQPLDRFPYYGASYNSTTYGYLDGWALAVQGFGQTSFAFDNRNILYRNTSGIHTGIDFGLVVQGVAQWDNEIVTSMCDGIVVPSRNGPFRGTIANGTGVSVRCFLAPLSYLEDADPSNNKYVDPDNNGIPNLSNLVIVYNHLEGTKPAGELCGGNPVGTPCVNLFQIVREDAPLGITDVAPGSNYDHLHLEVFLMRGYYRNYVRDDPAIMLNPLLVLRDQEAQVISVWIDTNYRFHPYVFGGNGAVHPQPTALGILAGQLNKWSTGGNNAGAMATVQPTPTPSGNFWAVQTLLPYGNVDWPVSMYVTDQNDQPLASKNVVDMVFSRFVNDPYRAPNCDLQFSADKTKCPYDSTR